MVKKKVQENKKGKKMAGEGGHKQRQTQIATGKQEKGEAGAFMGYCTFMVEQNCSQCVSTLVSIFKSNTK